MHTLACVCYLYVQHLDVCVQNWHGGSFHLKWSSKQQSQNWKVRYPKGTRGGLGGEVQLVLTKCWRIMAAVGNCNNFQDINIFWPSASKISFFKFHFTKCIKFLILQISFHQVHQNLHSSNFISPSASKSSFFKFHLRVSQCSNSLKFSRFYFFCWFFIFFWNVKVLHMKVAWQWVLCTSLLQPSIDPSVLVIL
jgi:hypothetical protein